MATLVIGRLEFDSTLGTVLASSGVTSLIKTPNNRYWFFVDIAGLPARFKFQPSTPLGALRFMLSYATTIETDAEFAVAAA